MNTLPGKTDDDLGGRGQAFLSRLVKGVAIGLISVLAACGGGSGDGGVASLQGKSVEAVSSTMTCADLAKQDLSGVLGAPATVTSATTVGNGSAAYCLVKGLITGTVNYEVRLPPAGWTQRFLMLGCGGYCGYVASPSDEATQTAGCVPFETNQMVTAASDLGHTGTIAGGTWARDNPQAVIDFAYAGMHKTTLVAKAITKAFYGREPSYSYYVGCSDGGREGLHEAQRYPGDYDGIVVGAPVIDEVATNTFYHGWNTRANTGTDGLAILTADKLPALAAAVKAACGDNQGLIQDARLCTYKAVSLVCPTGVDNASCLTPAQVDVVEKLWAGPVTEAGIHMTAGDMPKGSELNWLEYSVPLNGKVALDSNNSADFLFSVDFPNYMADFGQVSGITNGNMSFTNLGFSQLMKLQTFWDPINPDLGDFYKRGGKLFVWHGWEDSGASPRMALNYYDAVRTEMGRSVTNSFMKLYMLPGVGHCNTGANATAEDFLTPMQAWVEKGTAPDMVIMQFRASAVDATVLKTRPVYPFPSAVKYVSGDENVAASYARVDLPTGLTDRYDWLGLVNYKKGSQTYCNVVNGSPVCSVR